MIKIKNLTFEYPLAGASRFKALRQINLEIATGERVAIIGSSGAGKSTLLKCINRLHEPCAGSITIDGQEILTLPNAAMRKIRCRVAMIFQNFNLIQRIPAIDNVLLGRLSYVPFWRRYWYGFNYSAKDYKIAWDNLKQVQIESHGHRRVDRLSGGQQQRVGIARALTQEPDLLLADEPVSNLDPNIKGEIMGLLVNICTRKRLTLILSMHEIKLVRNYVSRVIGLSDGKLIFDGTPVQLTKGVYEEIYG